jgi:hypothetical protein
VAQTDQLDTDLDGYGEVCDTCPGFSNPDQSIPVWYRDADIDGYSDGTSVTDCVQPAGYRSAGDLTALTGDCDDSDGTINPGAADVLLDCDPSNDPAGDYYIAIEMQRSVGGGPWVPETYGAWEPKDGDVIRVDFKVMGPFGELTTTTDPNTVGRMNSNFTFSPAPVPAGVNNPTNYAGKYVNDSWEASAPVPSADFTYDITSFANQITLNSLDYLGSIAIRAAVSITKAGGALDNLQKDYYFPKDTDKDGLPDFCENPYGDLIPTADPDGDGLTNIQECRSTRWGRLVLATDPSSSVLDPSIYDTVAYVPEGTWQGTVSQIRTNPNRRDLFVKYIGFSLTHRFAIGAAFHNLANRVDVHALGDLLASGLSENNIDVATVSLEDRAYGSENPHIDRRSTRDWTFRTLGKASYGNDIDYGATCFIYKKSLDALFTDKPHYDYTTLVAGGRMRNQSDWSTTPNGELDPIKRTEDGNDNGVINGPEDKSGNGLLDGDHPVPNVTDLDGDGRIDEWDFRFELSAFNVNNDFPVQVELPVVGSTADIDPAFEYLLPQPLKHVITHELGHNTGVNLHTTDSTCLMYQQSNNFTRDGHFSPTAAALIRIHNQ